ncbi:MAG: hypothetical protein ACRENB_13445 [Gemmatimonadales bacterium]
MRIDRKKVGATAKVMAGAAAVAGRKAGKRIVMKADQMLATIGDAAHRRQRRRAAKSALGTFGKVALVTGAGIASVYAGRAIVRRRNGTTRSRSK